MAMVVAGEGSARLLNRRCCRVFKLRLPTVAQCHSGIGTQRLSTRGAACGDSFRATWTLWITCPKFAVLGRVNYGAADCFKTQAGTAGLALRRRVGRSVTPVPESVPAFTRSNPTGRATQSTYNLKIERRVKTSLNVFP